MAVWTPPRTWRPLDVSRNLTAWVLNKELRDNLQYLYDNLTGVPVVEAWIPITLDPLTSWVETGSPEAPAAYCKDAFGFVHLRGSIEGDNSGSVAFTLPAGYWPAERCRVPVVAQVGGGHLRIDTNGEVRVSDANGAGTPVGGYVALDSQFRIE